MAVSGAPRKLSEYYSAKAFDNSEFVGPRGLTVSDGCDGWVHFRGNDHFLERIIFIETERGDKDINRFIKEARLAALHRVSDRLVVTNHNVPVWDMNKSKVPNSIRLSNQTIRYILNRNGEECAPQWVRESLLDYLNAMGHAAR